MQGAVFNIITRQGGNRFLWDGSYYGQPSWLTSQPKRLPNLSTGLESGYERYRYRDATTTFGGPVSRDRLWFFAGYQYLRDMDSQPGADTTVPKDYKQDKFFGKLTWQLAPGWRLEQSLHHERWDNRELPTATKSPEATQRLRASVPAVNFGHLTHVSAANRVWDVSVGRFSYSQDIDRSAGDPDAWGVWDRASGVMRFAPMQIGELEQVRWTGKATLSLYKPGVLGADHDVKIGGQADRGDHRSLLVVPTGKRYEDNATPGTRLERKSGPSNAGGRFMTASVFVTDALSVGDRLTISAGLRFDHSRGISQDIRKLDADGADTGQRLTDRACSTPGTCSHRASGSRSNSRPTGEPCCGAAMAGSDRAFSPES